MESKDANAELTCKLKEIIELLKSQTPLNAWPEDAVRFFGAAVNESPEERQRWEVQAKVLRDEIDRLANPVMLGLAVQFLGLMGGLCGSARAGAAVKDERVATPRTEPAKTPQGEQGPEKICPDCMSRIPSAARVCRHCRYQFWT